MSAPITEARTHWTAAELRRLSAEERDRILSAAAELAAEEYQKDTALTAFEAFGEGDLYAYSSDSQPR
jgi:acyl-CoA reductase-like NAD-dependent aldehyde dehydrogenase